MLEGIIDIVKFIGKQGLSFRAVSQEAVYTLDDSISDHDFFYWACHFAWEIWCMLERITYTLH